MLRRQRLTSHTSARFRGLAPGPVSGQLYGRRPAWGTSHMLPLSCCLSATGIRFLGALFPPQELGSPYGRLTGSTHGDVTGPDGVSTFHTHEIRTGSGALFTPEATVSTRSSMSPRPPSAESHGQPLLSPALPPDPKRCRHEASTRVHSHSPSRPFPSPVTSSRTGALGLFPELRTQPLLATHVRAGPVTDTDRELRLGHRPTSNRRTHSTRATSCRTSHRQMSALRGRSGSFA